MCSTSKGGKGWSWEPLEPVFQALLPVLFGERRIASEKENVALKQIYHALLTVASCIFRSPRFRGGDCDSRVAAQMWFVAVRAAKRSYKPDRPFHKYGYVILSHICCDLGRRARARRAKAITRDVADSSSRVWELAAGREQRRHVRRALRTLKLTGKMSRNQRTAIAHKYYRGLSSKEAAERCGVNAATIDRWLYQARNLLRQELRKGA
jgi:RNA polymerase sigma factor (sigma-70 family)